MATDDIQRGNVRSPTLSENPGPFFSRSSSTDGPEDVKEEAKLGKWGMGILNDPKTHEVPGV